MNVLIIVALVLGIILMSMSIELIINHYMVNTLENNDDMEDWDDYEDDVMDRSE